MTVVGYIVHDIGPSLFYLLLMFLVTLPVVCS